MMYILKIGLGPKGSDHPYSKATIREKLLEVANAIDEADTAELVTNPKLVAEQITTPEGHPIGEWRFVGENEFPMTPQFKV